MLLGASEVHIIFSVRYSNIFITAPSPENLKTVFDFVFKGFDALDYQVHSKNSQPLDKFLSHNPLITGIVLDNHNFEMNYLPHQLTLSDHRSILIMRLFSQQMLSSTKLLYV